MTETPLYRSYRKVLEGSKDDALAWFKDQIWALLDEDQRKDVTDNGWFRIYQEVERTGSGGYNWGSGTESKDYFYVWRVAHPHNQYGNMRFVLRRNGTLNAVNLKAAAGQAIWQRKEQVRKSNVLEQNKALWERTFNYDVRDARKREHLGFHVTLSDKTPGKCSVELSAYDWQFGLNRTVYIEHLLDLCEWAETTRDYLKESF